MIDQIKILIVEDELLIARKLSRKLEKLGYEILGIASSGEKALEIVSKKQPDCVLMDIVIKGNMDGIQTAAIIYEKYNIPVIYTTAYVDDKTIARAEKTGSYGYLLKPFQDRELHASITMALNKHQQTNKIIKCLKIAEQSNKQLQDVIRINDNQEKTHEEIALENELNKALINQEFELYYQPRIQLKTGKIIGAEALLRWFHPERKIISPAIFIPIAEKTGLINPIGDFVLGEACQQLKKITYLNKKSPYFDKLNISVNLSAHQLKQKNLVNNIFNIIKNANIEPEFLEIELTETILMANIKETISTLSYLKSLGIKIAIDDFGTGYSSFSYLQQLPVDIIKIDRSFIIDIHLNPKNQAITEGLIKMSHQLNLEVVAEGVEKQEELEVLKAYNCDQIQGYLFSRPLPLMDFQKMVISNHLAFYVDKKIST